MKQGRDVTHFPTDVSGDGMKAKLEGEPAVRRAVAVRGVVWVGEDKACREAEGAAGGSSAAVGASEGHHVGQ